MRPDQELQTATGCLPGARAPMLQQPQLARSHRTHIVLSAINVHKLTLAAPFVSSVMHSGGIFLDYVNSDHATVHLPTNFDSTNLGRPPRSFDSKVEV